MVKEIQVLNSRDTHARSGARDGGARVVDGAWAVIEPSWVQLQQTPQPPPISPRREYQYTYTGSVSNSAAPAGIHTLAPATTLALRLAPLPPILLTEWGCRKGLYVCTTAASAAVVALAMVGRWLWRVVSITLYQAAAAVKRLLLDPLSRRWRSHHVNSRAG
jgi:hypothetical protein